MNTLVKVEVEIMKGETRGYFENAWLKSFHSFSFGEYYNPARVNFGDLKVINEDRISPSKGFPLHPHKNFEIFSYIIDGQIRHEDSMANVEIINNGGVQFTTAGTGIYHSEFNNSAQDELHLLQIWVKPHTNEVEPKYQLKYFSRESKKNQFCKIISADGSDGSIIITQDTRVYATLLEKNKKLEFKLDPTRQYFLHFATSKIPKDNWIKLNDEHELKQGDGAFIKSPAETTLIIHNIGPGDEEAEFVILDLLKK